MFKNANGFRRWLLAWFITAVISIVFLPVTVLAKKSGFPAWTTCTEDSECVAMPSACSEWEFVNKKFLAEREKFMFERRRTAPCLNLATRMKNQPAASCFHGICAAQRLIEPAKINCEELRVELDHIFFLGNACEAHADCERGFNHCATDCVPRTYSKLSKKTLTEWHAHFVNHCSHCSSKCLDPAHMVQGQWQPRCSQGRCAFLPLRRVMQE